MPLMENRLVLRAQTAPSAPGSGQVAVYAKSDGFLYLKSPAGVERPLEPGVVFPFFKGGPLTTGTGKFVIYNDSGSALTIKAVRASVTTAPVGASVIVDVNVNSTTIFTTQSNRPTITAGGTTSGKVTNMNVTSIADGQYFTVDIDQVGSTTPGSDLTVQILC